MGRKQKAAILRTDDPDTANGRWARRPRSGRRPPGAGRRPGGAAPGAPAGRRRAGRARPRMMPCLQLGEPPRSAPGMESMPMRVISEAGFQPETERFFERLGPQEGPNSKHEAGESGASPPDPELAGAPEPVKVRPDLILPLPERPVRVRLYRNVTAAVGPLLLWLHGGGVVGGSLDDVDVTCTGLARRTGLTVLSLDYRLAPEHPFPAALHGTYGTLARLRPYRHAPGGCRRPR